MAQSKPTYKMPPTAAFNNETVVTQNRQTEQEEMGARLKQITKGDCEPTSNGCHIQASPLNYFIN